MRQFSIIIVAALAVSLCSCVETSQEKLIGRWFNSTNSIRFTAEGGVRWNSRRGIAQGNYLYDGSKRRTSSSVPVHNLSLDLIRNGQSLQPEFELQFVGNDRVRLTLVSGSTDSRRPLVLTRASDDDDETLTPFEVANTETDLGRAATYGSQ